MLKEDLGVDDWVAANKKLRCTTETIDRALAILELRYDEDEEV